MRIVAVLVMVCALLLGCNSAYKDSLAIGKSHACNLKGVMVKAKADPSNKDLQEEVARLTRYIQFARENSGDADKFNEDLAEATKSCE